MGLAPSSPVPCLPVGIILNCPVWLGPGFAFQHQMLSFHDSLQNRFGQDLRQLLLTARRESTPMANLAAGLIPAGDLPKRRLRGWLKAAILAAASCAAWLACPTTAFAQTVGINSPTVNEGDSGSTTQSFTVTLDTAITDESTVDYSVTGGTASSGSDYTGDTSGTVTFSAGSAANATQTIGLTITGDVIDESDETIIVTLSNPQGDITGISSTANPGTMTITDDDDPPSGVTLSVDTASVGEDDASTTVTVTAALQGGTTFSDNQTMTIAIGASGDAATEGTDYATVNDITLTIAAGEASGTQTFSIDPSHDVIDEGTGETLSISGPATLNGVTVTDTTMTITDNDVAPTGITLSVDTASVGEDAASTTVTVTAALDGGTTFSDNQTMTIAIGTTGDAATEGTDYGTVDDITLTIAAGEASGTQTFSIDPSHDVIDEGTGETLSISGPATLNGVTVTDTTMTITDNDDPPSGITLSVDTASVGEDAASTTVTVTAALDGGTTFSDNQTMTIAIGTTGDAATEGTDYGTVDDITLTIAAGEASGTQTFSIDPSHDVIDEGTGETLSISGPATLNGVTVTDTTMTITDNDDPPSGITLSVDTASVGEDDDSTTVTVTAALQGGTTFSDDQTMTIAIGASGDVATEGTDYGTVDDITLTIAAGEASGTQTFSIDPSHDVIDEGTGETLSISGPATLNGVTVTDTTMTITDDDDPPSGITLSVDTASVGEDDDSTTVTVTAALQGGTTFSDDQTMTIAIGASGDVATEGTDYGTVNDITLTITAGQASGTQTFSIDPSDDVIDEGTGETLSISGPATLNGVTVTDTTMTITDDDDPPTGITLSVDTATVEENAGSTTVTVTATVDGGTTYSTETVVNVSVAGSDNETAVDFTTDKSSFTITIPAGEPSNTGTFTLTPTDDDVGEDNETVTVSGSVEALPMLLIDPVTLALTDDEADRTLTILGTTANEGDPASFSIRLSGRVASKVTVKWETVDGTAKSPDDYIRSSETLTFASATTELEKVVKIPTNSDTVAEGEETFQVQLLNVVSTLGVALDPNNATATGTIVDDDMAAAEARQNRVNEEVLPKVTQAIAASTLSAITGRIDSVVSGTTPGGVNLTSVSSLYHTLKSNEQALNDGTFNLAQVLGGSSFTLAVNPGEAGGHNSGPAVGGPAVWGSGDYRKLSGDEDSGVEWDGNVFSFHLGMDAPIPGRTDLLAGLSVSRSLGSFDYIDRTDPVEVEGSYRSSMTGVHPYVNWSLPQEGVNLWATAGYGWGEIEIDDDIGGLTSSDTTMQTGALGASVRFFSSDEWIKDGTTTLKLKGESSLAQVEVEGNDRIEPLTSDVQRLRLSVEGSHERSLAQGARLTPSLELGMRHDSGDGITGTGMELGGALRYVYPPTGLTLEGHSRVLVAHEADLEDWGIGGLIRIDPGTYKEGLSVSVAPAYGNTASSVSQLWDQDVLAWSENDQAANDSLPQGRLDAELGYGLPALGGDGLLTPYVALSLAGDDSQDYRLGGRLDIAQSISLSLEGQRRERPTTPPDHGMAVQVKLDW